jgi:hypothetical protein
MIYMALPHLLVYKPVSTQALIGSLKGSLIISSAAAIRGKLFISYVAETMPIQKHRKMNYPQIVYYVMRVQYLLIRFVLFT